MKLILLLLAAITVLTGCDSRKVEVNNRSIKPFEEITIIGSAFIVSQNSENIKLGLLKVALYNYDIFTNIIETYITNIMKIENEYKNKALQNNTDIKNCVNSFSENRVSSDEISTLLRREQEKPKPSEYELNLNILKLQRVINKGSELIEEINELKQKRIELKQSYLKFVSDIYFNCNILPFYFTLTDADGKFKLKLKENQIFVIMAQAERKISSSDTEYYRWVIKCNANDYKDKELFLSNNNIMETPETLMRVDKSIIDSLQISKN